MVEVSYAYSRLLCRSKQILVSKGRMGTVILRTVLEGQTAAACLN